MSVNNEINTAGPFAGNDTTTQFSFTFRIENKNQVAVYLEDLDGVTTQLTVDSDYTVANLQTNNGLINMTTAPATGERLLIVSDYLTTQLTEFESQGGFFPDVHERAFDKLTYLLLQLDRTTVKLRESTTRTSNLLPEPKEGFGIKWDANDNFVEENVSNNLKRKDVIGDNFMETELDMNGNRIINLPAPLDPTSPLRLQDLPAIVNLGEGAYVTLEQFDANAGTGGDDTAAFQAACDASFALNLPIQLLGKTYLIDPSDITVVGTDIPLKKGIYGTANSVLKCRTSPADARQFSLLDIFNKADITLKDFTIDGNLSADPVGGINSSNFDTWTGSRGIRFFNCTNIIVDNVKTQNTMQAGIVLLSCENAQISNCTTTRTRGNFGDGYYFSAKRVTVINCKAFDFTRIGFVIETTQGQPFLSKDVTFTGCIAEFGHDQSIRIGGTEYNSGFWFENYVDAACYNCKAIDTNDRGFVVANSYRAEFAAEAANYQYTPTMFNNCVVESTTDAQIGYGFAIDSLNEGLRGSVILENCVGRGAALFIYMAPRNTDDRFSVTVNNCHSTQTGTVGATQSFLMLLGGSASIKDSTVYYEAFDQVAWDDREIKYAAVNSFGLNTGDNLTIDNLRAFDPSFVERPIKLKFNINRSRGGLHLKMYNCMVEQDEERYKTAEFHSCVLTKIGSVVADSVLFSDCKILDTFGSGVSRLPVGTEIDYGDTVMQNCVFDFRESGGYFYMYNFGNQTETPNVRVLGCTFIKDVATSDYMIRTNSVPALKSIGGIHNYELSDCTFINTGASTTNPIVYTEGGSEPATTLIYGSGNYKSPTLTVDVGPNTTAPASINYAIANF